MAPPQVGDDHADSREGVTGLQQPHGRVEGEVVGHLAHQHEIDRFLPHRRRPGTGHRAGYSGPDGHLRRRSVQLEAYRLQV